MAVALNGMKVSQAYLEGKAVKETKALMAELCRHFYTLGWVSGTGGSITMKVHDHSIPKPHQIILLAPSGTFLFFLTFTFMRSSLIPFSSLCFYFPICISSFDFVHFSDFGLMKCVMLVLFTQSRDRILSCNNDQSFIQGISSCSLIIVIWNSQDIRLEGHEITHMEMIKGIKGHGYYDELVVPIIENTAYEYELTDSFAKAIEAYPKTTAVLVRNHGVFVWGDSWISAKTQSECYHYLFDAAIKLHQMGLDWSTPDHGPIQGARRGLSLAGESNLSGKARKTDGEIDPFPRCVVLDIEGTTTPISFVSEVLFPYACDNVGRHLSATYDTPDTQNDIMLLCSK
ncbi:hypothetical protein Lal_00022942 [Lupinus albus]|nr:hypothetical protein Lal_00022942 [Lupinus albus]